MIIEGKTLKKSKDRQTRLFLEALESRLLLTGLLAEWNFDQGAGQVANDSSRQIQDMEIGPDGKLWTARVGVGHERYPVGGGFEPEMTIFNSGRVGGFEFGPDRNGDGKQELYGSVDGEYGNIGYYDYETGLQLGTLITDVDIANYSLTIGPDRNNDGVGEIHVLNYYDKIRVYDGVTGVKITEMGEFLPLVYVSSGIPKPYQCVRWTLNGNDQPLGQNTITFSATGNTIAVATFNTGGFQGIIGDFNNSGTVDGLDIDLLRNDIALQTTNPSQDLNNDAVVNNSDVTYLLTDVLQTSISDVNLGHAVDALDLGIVRSNLGSNVPSGFMPWSQGNIIGDGAVDQIDLLALRFHFGDVSPSGPLQSTTVPSSSPPPPNDPERSPMASSGQVSAQPLTDIRQSSDFAMPTSSPSVELPQVDFADASFKQTRQDRSELSNVESSGSGVFERGHTGILLMV